MSPTPGSLTCVASLGESLAALVQRMQDASTRQGSALHFDYIGLTMFPITDVQALAQCVHDMLDKGLQETQPGHGALFLTVHAWPLSTRQARVTVRLAYTVRAGLQDLDKLALMARQPPNEVLHECWEMPSMRRDSLMRAFSEGVDADCLQHLSPGEGAVIELRLSLPHGGAEFEPDGLTELATVSAWLIGAESDESTLLAGRLHRDGWLVHQFAQVREAMGLWRSSESPTEPALVIVTEHASLSKEDLLALRQAWSPQCRVIYGVHADNVAPHTLVEQGIEIRTVPFSPADLREIKELASKLEAAREAISRVQKRQASRLRPVALVVDDGPVNRVLATEMMQVLGYDCDTADNGQAAVEYVARYRPDVILMDLEMPIMDGMEATERIRRYERHGAGRYTPISIIATTARDEQDVSRSWEAIGMSAFVPKPLDIDRLARALPAHASSH